ncbi:contact-dependent growth inhibition system immunity protein [Gluconobacter japonicus]|uniref:CdiI family contact-dependent growth inhibition immunity protein n=2 Tax=Gluconobacter japonicus TaxID=376620 RepID=A0A9Q2FP14_GLUJA|nr:contact-dependent growth inhibition system immunity protein [Gluconobacter japonicus]MBF0871896.1 CdiI family contact-dependent growth inhibition immunity protein [Gluconobacter japonicus]
MSPRFLVVECIEIWGGGYFSRTGWSTHAPKDAPPLWIGENFRKALLSSEYFNKPGEPSLNREEVDAMSKTSNARRLAFWEEVASTYGYKKREQAGSCCDMVFAQWHYLVDDFVILTPSKRTTGGHFAWPSNTKQHKEKVMHVPLSVSDEDLGLAVQEALSRCEVPKRQTVNMLGRQST